VIFGSWEVVAGVCLDASHLVCGETGGERGDMVSWEVVSLEGGGVLGLVFED